MKKVSTSEMRNVNGSYRVICKACGKTKHTILYISVEGFYLEHTLKHGTDKYVMWDTRYANASKIYG